MGRAARRFYLAVFTLFGVNHAQSAHALHTRPETCAVDPNAIVSDACASYSTLDSLNTQLLPTLQSLTHDSDFFSYYRLNLYDKVCPFWNDESGSCGNRACAVDTIDNEEDIPLIWRANELGKLEGPKAQHPAKPQQNKQRPLMGELGVNVGESCVVEYDDECDERDYCVPEDESAAGKGDYVSLVDNPERFTGYSGPSANQVWEHIYKENCFSRGPESATPQKSSSGTGLGYSGHQRQAADDLRSVMKHNPRNTADEELTLELDDQCLEQRTFYRVISGMHASISTHLCYDYLNQTTGKWGPNLSCYKERLHDHPDRISNLYFNYALVLRAVAKVRNVLAHYTFCSGDPEQDALTKQKVLTLADKIAAGPKIYDESLLFADPSVQGLKEDFRNRFRNVSRTMDCVGCDKCRLWGKLQTAGYGTALKILFEFDEKDNSKNPPLRRTELVALVNTLDRISHSLSAGADFEKMLHDEAEQAGSSGRTMDGQVHAKHEPARVTEQEGSRPANDAQSPAFTRQDADAVDDGFGSWEEDRRKVEEASTFSQDAWAEVRLIWNTTKYVLTAWIEIPSNLFKIVIIFFRDIWEYWLGRSNILFAGLQKVYELTRSSGVEDSGPAGHGTHHERDEI